MSSKARRRFGVILILIVGGVGAFLGRGDGQAQQAGPAPDRGGEDEKLKRFQYGYDLGRERAGFSGLPMVQIFVDERVDNAALEACLESPEIAELMPFFTGVLITPEEEESYPRRLRQRELHQVVVRGLNGKVLGLLPPEFTCGELFEMLERIPRTMILKPKRSPIYRRLLESPDAIDKVIERGEADRARRFIDFLMELEGRDHPAVLAAEARLAGR